MVVGALTAARDAILGRVRAAAGPAPRIERGYRRSGGLAPQARVELLCERIGDYNAEVRRVEPEQLGGTIAEALEARGARRVGVPPELPESWRPRGLEVVEDDGLSPAELAALDGVVTGCTLAVAETGTIVLSSGQTEGRRALTLVPDLHVCVVYEEDVVGILPEATPALAELARERRPLTFVSGPSATSDIELSRVEGVHGPRTLVVLVTRRASSAARARTS
jgi:L-lactate dehydrogenase complex protein LldG